MRFNVIFHVPVNAFYLYEIWIKLSNNYLKTFLFDQWVMTVYNKVVSDIKYFFSAIIHYLYVYERLLGVSNKYFSMYINILPMGYDSL